MLQVTACDLPEVKLLSYAAKRDNRGLFFPVFDRQAMQDAGLCADFAREMHYRVATCHTFYGLHVQNSPKAQTKLLYCTKGRFLDFAVDVRKGSSTYARWVCAELSAENRRQLVIPAGFAHGALILEDDTHIAMRIDVDFDKTLARAIHWQDAEIALVLGVDKPILSPADEVAPPLALAGCNL